MPELGRRGVSGVGFQVSAGEEGKCSVFRKEIVLFDILIEYMMPRGMRS
jgi:hypothetical protein